MIGTDFMKISIKLKGFCGYLRSLFSNPKFRFILFINFCGMAQKLKSKIDYRREFEGNFK